MKSKNIGEFSRIFGANPRNRIIEFFLEMKELDFGVGDVAKETGLNRATSYNVVEKLIKKDYLVQTRKIGGSQLYKLNTKKEEVRFLIKVFNLLLKNIVKEQKKVYA